MTERLDMWYGICQAEHWWITRPQNQPASAICAWRALCFPAAPRPLLRHSRRTYAPSDHRIVPSWDLLAPPADRGSRMDATESCGQPYDHYGDWIECRLDYNHDGNCTDANRTAREERTDQGWVF